MLPLRGEEIVRRTGTGMKFGAAAPPGDPRFPAASPSRAFGDPSRTGCPPGRYGMKLGGIADARGWKESTLARSSGGRRSHLGEHGPGAK